MDIYRLREQETYGHLTLKDKSPFEVKQQRAWLVPRWVADKEYHVL